MLKTAFLFDLTRLSLLWVLCLPVAFLSWLQGELPVLTEKSPWASAPGCTYGEALFPACIISLLPTSHVQDYNAAIFLLEIIWKTFANKA